MHLFDTMREGVVMGHGKAFHHGKSVTATAAAALLAKTTPHRSKKSAVEAATAVAAAPIAKTAPHPGKTRDRRRSPGKGTG